MAVKLKWLCFLKFNPNSPVIGREWFVLLSRISVYLYKQEFGVRRTLLMDRRSYLLQTADFTTEIHFAVQLQGGFAANP